MPETLEEGLGGGPGVQRAGRAVLRAPRGRGHFCVCALKVAWPGPERWQGSVA